jgi:hypothetical protein
MQEQYDVVVVGGGPGGCAAAVAAARNGAKVALIERYGFLGGMATAGLVNPFMPTGTTLEKEVVGGFYKEVRDALAMREAARGRATIKDGRTFDEEDLKVVLDEMMKAAGVDVWFHTYFVSAKTARGKIKFIRVVNKSGETDFAAKIFIDATGDADLSTRAGATIEQGRASDGRVQPMTLCFRVGGVAMAKFDRAKGDINRIYREERAKRAWINPRGDVLIFPSAHPNTLHFNTTRVSANPVDARALSAAEMEGRAQAQEMIDFLRAKISGFESAYLDHTAAQIGVRESRRVVGEYMLTVEDVLEARKFRDGIARNAYPVDIHSPTDGTTDIRRLKIGTSHEIPWRSLVPKGLGNLLVASRCISSTHEAHSSLRVMPVVMAIGQAAGTAAAMCVKSGRTPKRVNARDLRKLLAEQGADLEREPGSSKPV